jgi:hypothetical protein
MLWQVGQIKSVALRAFDEDVHIFIGDHIASSPLATVIDRLPLHGTLYQIANGTRGAIIAEPYNANARISMIEQYAIDVSAVSSFWGGSANWHPGQALGAQDAFDYGDSQLTWCAH